MFMALFVVYGFDTAGTFGEETLDASRQAPRGVLSAIWISGIVGAIFLLAVILSFQDMTRRGGDRTGVRVPDRRHHQAEPHRPRSAASRMGDLYLFVILVAVYVCTLAIQGATVRLMFSMGRDRRLPFGRVVGPRQPLVQDPGQRGDRRRHPGRDPVPRDRRRSPAIYIVDRRRPG